MLAAIVLTAALAWQGGAAAGPSMKLANADAKIGGTLVSGAIFGLEPKTLNPNLRQDDGALRIAALLHITLVSTDFINGTGVHPALAEKWTVTPTSLTFNLVKNAKWHDGKPVTSADVKFSYEQIIQQKGGALRYFEDVQSIDAPDPYTIVIRMKKPDATLLGNLGTWTAPIILPKHVYDAPGDWTQNPANNKPVGGGPFKFVEWTKGSHVILEANQDFHMGRPAIQRFIMRFYNLPNLITAYETGEVKYVYELLPFSEIFRFKRDSKYAIDFHYRGLSSQIQLNLKRKPFDDVRVRRALALAVDRQELTRRVYNGLAPVNAGAMPFNWARTDKYDFKYDPAEAERLLDQAGLRKGADGVRFRTTLSLSPVMSWPDMGTVVQEMWKKIGVEITIESMDFPSLFTKAGEKKDFDTVASNVIISHEPAELGRFVNGDGDRNWGGYANPKVDELMDRGRRLTDLNQRKQIYDEVQKILQDEVWRIYLVEFPYHQPIWAEVKDPFWNKALSNRSHNNYQGFLYTYISK